MWLLVAPWCHNMIVTRASRMEHAATQTSKLTQDFPTGSNIHDYLFDRNALNCSMRNTPHDIAIV